MGLSILGDLIGPVKDLVGEIVVDPNKRDQINLALQQLSDTADARVSAEMIAQIGVNNTEAQSKSLFVAGWRPFIGWTGGAGIAWTFVVSPFAGWITALTGSQAHMPAIDSSQLMTLVLAMLGVGTMRSIEKIRGVSSDTMQMPTVNTAAPAKDADSQDILNQLRAAAPPIPDKAPWAS